MVGECFLMGERVLVEKVYEQHPTGFGGRIVYKIKCPHCGMVQNTVNFFKGVKNVYCLLCKNKIKPKYLNNSINS